MARLNTTGRNQPRPSGRDTLHPAFDLAPGQRAAVDQAYAVFLDHHAPFVTAIAARMLQDLRRDVAADPEHRIVFLGRDGHSYAAALRGLDPDFFRDHCTEIVVSRVVVDAALQDLERHTDARFDAVEAFRVRHRVHPHEVDGAFRALTGYLVNSAVPIDRADASVTLIDQRAKGELYVRGLMLDGKRKSMQPMAGRLGVDHQQLQQFVTSSTWDHAEVRKRLARWAESFIEPRVRDRRHRLPRRTGLTRREWPECTPGRWGRSGTARSGSACTQ